MAVDSYPPQATTPMDLGVPTATILEYAGAALPSTEFLWADGTAVSRTVYAQLYQQLGGASSPYGQGDGTTTFNVPDRRGRVAVGAGAGAGLSTRSPGDKFGQEDLVVPSHGHSHSHTAGTTGDTANYQHTHTFTTAAETQDHSHGTAPDVTWAGTGSGSVTRKGGGNTAQTAGRSAAHNHTGTSDWANANHGHTVTVNAGDQTTGVSPTGQNMPPALVCNFIIKT